MSDDETDGFQTYEDAVQAHLDAKNGQNAVTFALVGLGIGPNLHDNRRNVLAVGFQQCSLMLAKPVAESQAFGPVTTTALMKFTRPSRWSFSLE
jgi:hypothetical protein